MELAIILVNWNRSTDTINCINSIKCSGYKDYKIIVIDNNSVECERSILKSYSTDECEFYYLNQNTGYTGGNNFGIKIALQQRAKYVLLLNNDTFLADTALEFLVERMKISTEIAVLSPKIYFYPDSNILWSGAPRFNGLLLMGYLNGYREIDRGQCDLFEYVEYVSGCAMMIRASVLSEIGLLTEEFFAVCEDLDFCLRVRGGGYKIAYDPRSIIYHIESASSGGSNGPHYVYYQTRNYLLFHKIWSKNLGQLILSQTYYFIFIAKRSLNFIFTGKWKAFLGLLFGVHDYLLGRFGCRYYRILSK